MCCFVLPCGFLLVLARFGLACRALHVLTVVGLVSLSPGKLAAHDGAANRAQMKFSKKRSLGSRTAPSKTFYAVQVCPYLRACRLAVSSSQSLVASRVSLLSRLVSPVVFFHANMISLESHA